MIPVIWYNGCRGNWDHGTLMQIFEKHPKAFHQWNNKEKWLNLEKYKRAIVIVAGKPNPEGLRDYLITLDSGIVILTSEEDAYFNWQYAIPDHLDLWTQYYSPSTKSEIKTRLLLGAPYHRMKDYKINTHLPKKYLWSFVGQVQNPFRQQCVEVLKSMPDGYLHIADGFAGQCNGLEYQKYLDIMCQSYFVICPAGSMCVDSFRLYEAMECGAIPITDERSPRDPKDFNYWESVISRNTIMKVDDWNDLVWVFQNRSFLDPHAFINYNDWWFDYKEQLEKKLLNAANTY